jgi:aminoglycoside phosphotransferase (APT) family kinase protein
MVTEDRPLAGRSQGDAGVGGAGDGPGRVPVRAAAADVVEEMLDAENGVPTAPVHGDLGMHNILWHESEDPSAELRISGLIDLDHAALADPAIDVAALLGQFGGAAVGSVVEPPTLRRAMLHRATLSLQVAASAELRRDYSLRDFALDNFTRRWDARTLYDPDGRVPSH